MSISTRKADTNAILSHFFLCDKAVIIRFLHALANKRRNLFQKNLTQVNSLFEWKLFPYFRINYHIYNNYSVIGCECFF